MYPTLNRHDPRGEYRDLNSVVDYTLESGTT